MPYAINACIRPGGSLWRRQLDGNIGFRHQNQCAIDPTDERKPFYSSPKKRWFAGTGLDGSEAVDNNFLDRCYDPMVLLRKTIIPTGR